MKSKKIITLITALALFLLLEWCAGAEPVLQSSESYVSLDDTGYEKITLTYSASYTLESDGSNASLNKESGYKNYIKISGSISNISVSDSKGELEFTTRSENENVTVNGGNITLIQFNFRSPLNEGDYYTVIIRFSKEIEKPADNFAYEIDYEWDTPPLHMDVVSRLSGKYELYDSLTNPASTFSDDSYLVMHWVGYSTPGFITRLSFGEIRETSGTKITENKSEINPVKEDEYKKYLMPAALLAALIIVIIVLSLLFLYKNKKPDKKPDSIAAGKVEKTLTPQELAIVEELRIENNQNQTELCKKTGIPRSTMSRIISRLESKGVIEKTEEGMSNRVKLAEWMK